MGDNYDSILIVILMYPRNIANMASLLELLVMNFCFKGSSYKWK